MVERAQPSTGYWQTESGRLHPDGETGNPSYCSSVVSSLGMVKLHLSTCCRCPIATATLDEDETTWVER
jgi:hypothetical protein